MNDRRTFLATLGAGLAAFAVAPFKWMERRQPGAAYRIIEDDRHVLWGEDGRMEMVRRT